MRKEFRITALIIGVLSIVAGIYMFISPITSLASLSFFFRGGYVYKWCV